MSLLGRVARGLARVVAGKQGTGPRAERIAPVSRAAPGRADLSGFSVPEPPAEPELEVEVPLPGSLLLDVREPDEYRSGVAEGALLLPMDAVPHHLADLPRDRPITVYCAAGARSAGVAHWLREQGIAQAWSLAGGIGALRFGGARMVVPAGLAPGTRVRVRGEVAGAAFAGDAEVVEDRGETVRVRVIDDFGFQVVGEVGRGALAPASDGAVLAGSHSHPASPRSG